MHYKFQDAKYTLTGSHTHLPSCWFGLQVAPMRQDPWQAGYRLL